MTCTQALPGYALLAGFAWAREQIDTDWSLEFHDHIECNEMDMVAGVPSSQRASRTA